MGREVLVLLELMALGIGLLVYGVVGLFAWQFVLSLVARTVKGRKSKDSGAHDNGHKGVRKRSPRGVHESPSRMKIRHWPEFALMRAIGLHRARSRDTRINALGRAQVEYVAELLRDRFASERARERFAETVAGVAWIIERHGVLARKLAGEWQRRIDDRLDLQRTGGKLRRVGASGPEPTTAAALQAEPPETAVACLD